VLISNTPIESNQTNIVTDNINFSTNQGGKIGFSDHLEYDPNLGTLLIDGPDGELKLRGITTEPPNADANTLNVYSKNIGGRMMLKMKGPSGFDTPLQPLVALNKIGWWNPPGNGTATSAIVGFDTPTTQGTVTARSVATTNSFTRTRRLGFVSSTAAGAVAGHYSPAAQFTVGDGAGLGGFYYVCRFGISDTTFTATARMFVGLTSSVAVATNVDPATLTNCIGVGCSSDTTGLLLYYGGSAAQTPITLGATSFPTNSAANNAVAYELMLFSPTNRNDTVNYRVLNLATGISVSGTITAATAGTQLPLSTTFLAHRAWRTNNAAANAVGIDVISVYIESDS
jgi:hypothetical protein